MLGVLRRASEYRFLLIVDELATSACTHRLCSEVCSSFAPESTCILRSSSSSLELGVESRVHHVSLSAHHHSTRPLFERPSESHGAESSLTEYCMSIVGSDRKFVIIDSVNDLFLEYTETEILRAFQALMNRGCSVLGVWHGDGFLGEYMGGIVPVEERGETPSGVSARLRLYADVCIELHQSIARSVHSDVAYLHTDSADLFSDMRESSKVEDHSSSLTGSHSSGRRAFSGAPSGERASHSVPSSGRLCFLEATSTGKEMLMYERPDIRCLTVSKRKMSKLVRHEEWFSFSLLDGFTLVVAKDVAKLRSDISVGKTMEASFSVSMTESEKAAKEAVVLPFERGKRREEWAARNGSSPQVGNEEEEKRILVTGNASTIFVEPEELFDDEDPDADLDL